MPRSMRFREFPIVMMRVTLAAVALSIGGAGTVAAAPLEDLDLVSASGPHRFHVEVMRTEPELEHGLMDRRYLPPDRGMLFDFKQSKPVMMWMKNTYIPLDMVFIGADGRVVSTAQNTEPLSERIIPSNGDALGVLEINAGTVAKIGLKPGDRVENGMFQPR